MWIAAWAFVACQEAPETPRAPRPMPRVDVRREACGGAGEPEPSGHLFPREGWDGVGPSTPVGYTGWDAETARLVLWGPDELDVAGTTSLSPGGMMLFVPSERLLPDAWYTAEAWLDGRCLTSAWQTSTTGAPVARDDWRVYRLGEPWGADAFIWSAFIPEGVRLSLVEGEGGAPAVRLAVYEEDQSLVRPIYVPPEQDLCRPTLTLPAVQWDNPWITAGVDRALVGLGGSLTTMEGLEVTAGVGRGRIDGVRLRGAIDLRADPALCLVFARPCVPCADGAPGCLTLDLAWVSVDAGLPVKPAVEVTAADVAANEDCQPLAPFP